MSKLIDFINKMEEEQKDLQQVFEHQRKELVELIDTITPDKLLNLSNYTQYSRLINTAKRIEETGIKLRALYYATHLTGEQ